MSSTYDRTHAKKVVLHHFGDGLPAAKSKDEAFRRANPHGYEFPEYDYIVLDDGAVLTARPLNYIGAHCIATKQKYLYGDNWWNKNSIGVAMAIDNTKYQPSQAMVNGLINLLTDLCRRQGMTIDDLYPHFQVTATSCPGGSYAKLGVDTGYFDYDVVEKAVYRNMNPVSTPAPQPQPTPAPVTPAPVETPPAPPVVVVEPPVEQPKPIPQPVPAEPTQVPVGANPWEHLKDVKLWLAVLGLVKILTDLFGLKVITDDKINDYANALASLAAGIGVISTYKK